MPAKLSQCFHRGNLHSASDKIIMNLSSEKGILTERNDDPDEVHEEVIPPEIVCLWTAVGHPIKIVVKQTGGIV